MISVIRFSRCIIFAVLALLSLGISSSSAYAEKKDEKEKQLILHSPLKSAELPSPGTPFVLSFDLSRIEGVIARERLLVIRDGKLLDATLIEGPTEGSEELSHNATIHAPLVELKYRALITTADGKIITSPSYTLRRSCIPNLALSSIDDPAGAPLQERLARYLGQARHLEKDLAQYDEALSLLESLVGQMKEEK